MNGFLSIALDLFAKIHYNVFDCVAIHCEVICINKRKFLTELSKLLTFMYEEDRQMAISMYEKMFSFADDETALLQFLGSPTKQAVMIARAYNAKERKLAVTSQTGDNEADVASGDTPPFVKAIMNIHNDAEGLELVHQGVIRNQISIFGEEEDEEDPYEMTEEEEAALFTPDEESNAPAEKAPEETPVAPAEEPAAEKKLDETQEEKSAESEEIPAFELPDFTLEMPDEVAEFIAAAENYDMPDSDTASHPPVSYSAVNTETSEEAAAKEQTDKDAADASDGELAKKVVFVDEAPAENYAMDLGPVPEEQRSEADEIDAYIATFQDKEEQEKKAEDAQSVPEQTTLTEFSETKDLPDEPAMPWKKENPADTSGKANMPLVILYLIIAVPIVSCGVLILLVPALAFLGFGVVSGYAGFQVMMLAFGHFAVFADIMVVIGVALVLFALALLFFWIFLWFIGGAIAWLINASIRLGGKICYKEDKAS